jgi:DNA repair protein RadC
MALNPDDRPRERLHKTGPASLSDAELVALLIGTGRRGESALDLAAGLLARLGGLPGLGEALAPELVAHPGVGPARAGVLQAALELGRRVTGARPSRGDRLTSPGALWEHFRARLAHAAWEEFWIVGLDVRHRLQLELLIARGSLTGVEVHPREVFRPLIRAGCASALLCHNHPSGDPTPSRQDVELTTRLRDVGEMTGIQVLDHVVVGAEGYVSLAERGWVHR